MPFGHFSALGAAARLSNRRGATARLSPQAGGDRRSSRSLLGGCAAVGPDYKPPPLPPAAQAPDYTPAPLPAETAAASGFAGQAQQWVKGQDIPAQWWAMFHSEALDRLIRSALDHSPTLASAQAALREARENYNAQSGRLRAPAVDAQLGVGARAGVGAVDRGAQRRVVHALQRLGQRLLHRRRVRRHAAPARECRRRRSIRSASRSRRPT